MGGIQCKREFRHRVKLGDAESDAEKVNVQDLLNQMKNRVRQNLQLIFAGSFSSVHAQFFERGRRTSPYISSSSSCKRLGGLAARGKTPLNANTETFMPLYEVFIPNENNDGKGRKGQVRADSWTAALKTGLKKVGGERSRYAFFDVRY